MEGDYFDSTSSVSSQPLPTPSDMPYQTPFMESSRKSSGRANSSAFTSITPPLPQHDIHTSKDASDGQASEKRNSRDLTAGLHAQLVSQILELRRTIESKDVFIDQLESTLADERSGNEALEDELKRNVRETKSMRRQLHSIEGSTLAAMEELCKERDAANATSSELRRKVEATSKQLKAEQEHVDQVHKEWESEKAKWTQERSTLVRKNEVAEGRLKHVIEEVTMHHMNNQPLAMPAEDDKENLPPLREGMTSMHSSPTKSRKHRRNQSSLSSLNSIRQSKDLNGLSLADELDLDTADEDGSEVEMSDQESRLRKARESRSSGVTNAKARKVLGIVSGLEKLQSVPEAKPRPASRRLDGTVVEEVAPEASSEVVAAAHRMVQAVGGRSEPSQQSRVQELEAIEANQRRKRDPILRSPKSHSRTRSEPSQKLESSQVSMADAVASPPGSPRSINSFVSAVGTHRQDTIERLEMASASTQTDEIGQPQISSPPPPIRAPPPIPVEVPSIAIHPPDSTGPLSPGDAVLPPRTRSAGCQTDIYSPIETSDTGAQTDVIRVDRRPIKLPAHLLPSALNFDSDQAPSTANDSAQFREHANQRSVPPFPSPTLPVFEELSSSNKATQLDDVLPEAPESNWSRLRKTLMLNNRQAKPLEADPFTGHDDTYTSESDYTHATTTRGKRPQKYTRPSFDPPTPVPEDEKVAASRPVMTRAPQSEGSRGSFERQNNSTRYHSYTISNKGKYPQQISSFGPPQRPGSPSSVGSSSAWSGTQPPVPIPMRTSSAGLGRKSRSSGQSSPTRRSGASSPTKRFEGMRVGKKPLLRKARSPPALTSTDAPGESLPRSPLSRESFASAELSRSPVPGSASLPTRQAGHVRSSSSQTRRLSSFQPTGNASVGDNGQHTVAHALKETMIGEWMWKYTRKRKSFGISDATGDNGVVRHKRWMWISPDERTVMWSSKQPRSETAWLGKSGRKLQITQVLDVKGDTSLKSQRGGFNQSILIVTPARTLKFTAITRERHYIWLTALSFLAAHTSNQSLDLSYFARPEQASQLPDQTQAHVTSETGSRGSRNRWSTKNRSSRQSSGYATPSIPEASASVEGSSLVMPAKPTRPAPTAPLERYLPDTALAPSIPRVPGNSSSTQLNLHGRKRSASTTGVVSSRASSRAANSGTSSLRNFPTNLTTSAGNRSIVISAPMPSVTSARPPMPSLPSSHAGSTGRPRSQTIHYGLGKQPSTPLADPGDPENRFAEFTIGVEEVIGGMGNGAGSFGAMEFGTNNSFFDAAGRRRYNPRRSGQILDGALTKEQMEAMDAKAALGDVPGPLSSHPIEENEDTNADGTISENHGHQTIPSVDSVAPPSIPRKSGVSGQASSRAGSESGREGAQSRTSGRRKWF